MRTWVTIFALLVLWCHCNPNAYAHGEDKAGPHGGVIRMPGAFHTEVVVKGKHDLMVYLLDINWQNPSVKNSSLKVESGKVKAKCLANQDAFLCTFAKPFDLSRPGQLRLESQREGQRGNVVVYDLPLTRR